MKTASPATSSSSAFPVLAFAVCLIALCWAYLLLSETPRGQVSGVAVLANLEHAPLADCDIYLTPAPNAAQTDSGESGGGTTPASHNGAEADVRERRHAKTDKLGRFLLRNVPAGRYQLSASARWHSAPEVVVDVREGKLSTVPLTLKRSEADLSVGDHQSVFATSEKPFLPVRGYATLPIPKSGKNGAPGAISTDALRAAKKLHVKVWRTRLGDVLTRADAAADLDKLRHSYDGKEAVLTPALLRPAPDVAPAPQLITDADVPIAASDREGFFAEHFSLPSTQNKPGLYLVKFSFGSFSACSYVVVTDVALVVKRASRANQTVVYAADVMKGTPIAGAKVRVLKQGKTVARGETAADGVVAIDTPPSVARADDQENDAPLLTMATVGDDEAVVSGTSSYGGEESKRYAVHVLTDRTVYRPGDTISYKAIARTRRDNDGQQQAYSVPDDVSAQIELRDESGNLIARQNKTTNRHGAVWGTMETSKEGATGTYTLTTTLGGETHDSQIVVAAYRKPEFSVTVTPQKTRLIRGEPIQMTVKATYYFGGPVAGGKVHYYWFRDADWSAEYGDAMESEDYDENDASSYRSKSYQSYFGEGMGDGEIQLDENGEAVITARTDIRHLPDPERDKTQEEIEKDNKAGEEVIPQVETYRLTAQVEDEAKRSVESDGSAAVAASDLTVGVAPEGYVATPDKAMPVFVTVRDGQTKQPKAGVPVTLLAVYDTWNKIKKESVAVPLTKPQTETTGSDGRAVFQVVPPRAGDVRLVATVQDDAKRTTKAEGNVWVASDTGDNLDTDYGDLTLLSDKRHYEPGDTAKVLVNTSRVGQSVLLSVEGERVYQTVVLPITKKSTVYTLPILADWGPNVTLSANYVKDKKFASSETPLRIRVQAQNLTVAVRAVNVPANKKYQPGDTATFAVSVKDANGKPVASDFAIGVVDESIYALREDNPKATAQTFYPKRSNRVSTQYSFNVEYLGDVSKAEPKIKARTKFRDTAFWRASNQTDANGQATVSLTLPDNLTTWRATVQAVSDRTGVGYAKTKIVSAKPFFVRLNAPRYLVGGDTSVLSALVHNDTGQEQQVRVRLTASALTVAGAETQTLIVKSGSVGTVTWQISPQGNGVADRAGLRLTAWTGALAPDSKPYTDGIEQTLPLRAFGRTTYTPFAGTVDTSTNSEGQKITLLPGALLDETRLTVRVTPSVRGALAGGVEYLVGFPYGCTEQTLSRFVPDLLAQKYDLLTGEAANKKDLSRMVGDGVTRLARMQHPSGAWGWWETDSDDPFMTAYALTGLAQAKASGYEVSDTMLQSAMKAAAEMAQTKPVRQRPFLLYALHQAGYKDTNNLLRAPFRYTAARTHLVPEKLPVDALAYLVLLGHDLNEDATPFYTELQKRSIEEGSLLHFTAYPQKSGNGYDGICSDRMASALALRALLAVRPDDKRIPAILRYLMLSRTGSYFGDTRDTAWVLTAFCDYLNVYPREAAPPSGTINVLLNGKTVETIEAQNDNRMENGEVILKIPTGLLQDGDNTLALSREGGANKGGTIFYSGELAQTVAAPRTGDLPPIADGVHITREVLRVVPKKVNNFWQLSTEPTGGTIKQGDQLRIRLTVTADRDASYILIEDTFPSGAEVTERGTADEEVADGGNGSHFWYDHVDISDSTIAFFAGKLPKGKHVLEYNLRAQTPGKSAALPAFVRAMYDPTFKGESGTTGMEIKP